MPQTYPHQRTITIHREPAKQNFLGIQNDNWQAAARDLGGHATLLYLYLASNANGFALALSQKAVTEAIGMPRSTYHDQFHKLVSKGYLVLEHGNTYAFYEKPLPRPGEEDKNAMSGDGFETPQENTSISSGGQTLPPMDREINNINNTINKKNIEEAPLKGKYHVEMPIKEVFIPNPDEVRRKEKSLPSPWQNEKGEFIF